MKTIIKLHLVIFLFIPIIGFTQAGVDWQLIGNATLPGAVLGTNNAQPLNMRTAGALKASLTVPGDFNLVLVTRAFQIAGQPVLWHKGNPRNIFVGVGAGNNHLGPAGNNSYVGSNAGFSGSGSLLNQQNTFVGGDAGFNNDGGENVFVGYHAAFGITGISTNGLTAVGTLAGETGSQNGETVFVGYSAGRATNSTANCFVGYRSGENNTNGFNNSFFGTNAGSANQAHNNNTYIGRSSGANSNGNKNTCVGGLSGTSGVGNRNVLLGYNTMSAATGGRQNVIIGSDANSTTTGNDFNTMVGTDAGLAYTTGARNTFIGYQTALNQTTGNNNAYLGTNTGNNITSGNNNTFIGGNANATNASSSLNNAAAIGSNAQVTNNDHMILGDNNVNVGIGLSADASGPQNKLEINTVATSAIPGVSGLRFRDLTTASTPQPNLGAGILSVDVNGDVVYVNSTNIGNYCSALTPNPLGDDYEIPMNIYNYYFSGQGTGRANVGVGLPCSTILGGKVHAYQLANNWFLGPNFGVSVAGRFDNYTSTNAFLGFGVFANAAGPSAAWNIGIFGTATNAALANFAGYFQGDVFITGTTTGVGVGTFSDKNIKTNISSIVSNMEVINKLRPVKYQYNSSYAPQLKLNNHTNYGFIAQEVENIIPELVTTNTVMATFDSVGQVINPEKVIKSLNYDAIIPFAIGGIQELHSKQKEMQASLDKAGLSDMQVKTNINNFNALDKIKTLNPVQYNFTNANVPQLTFKSNLDYGFVAQQLETVYPELVDTIRVNATYDSLGTVVNPSKVLKTVNYKAMSALLVRSVQEQQQTIDSLRSTQNVILQQLSALASQINSCCSNTNAARQSNSSINQLDVELSDKDAIILNQNVPNPFAEQTTITYNVPVSVDKAQLIFFNNLGQVIQTVDIKTRGKGKVNVFASDLSSGLYNYSLVADGKVIDSKKMVRE